MVHLWLNFNYHDSHISTISNCPQFSVQTHCSPLPDKKKKPLSTDSYMHLSKNSLKVSIKLQGLRLSECQSLEHGIKLCYGAVHTLCIQEKLEWVISMY